MIVSAAQVFRDLENEKWSPVVLVVGEESYQAFEIIRAFRKKFVKEEASRALNYEAFDGEALDSAVLLNSLETLPGLFDEADSTRLVTCTRFEKISSSGLERLEVYLKNPSPSTICVLWASKADKRKAWYKAIETNGQIIEVHEPYEREWPKWQSHFEKKIEKRVSPEAWEALLELSGRTLSVVANEVEKLALFVGERKLISADDVAQFLGAALGGDVFAFIENVMMKDFSEAMRRYYHLLQGGENDIKLLSLLVRQFRLISQYHDTPGPIRADGKAMASRLGVHPFLVTKIAAQAKKNPADVIQRAIIQLAETDYRLKTGAGDLFSLFLAPYLAA